VAGKALGQDPRRGRRGPYTEAKEVVGGVLFLETDTIDEAAAIAVGWPGVASGRTMIEIRPTVTR
jgi:hypothetical protein